MIKNFAFIIIAISGLLLWNTALHAQFDDPVQTITQESPIVIELFTSQSCSSCPPADKNLLELSKQPGAITLGFHVTYWDHLHWKDTLSHKFATERQHKYSEKAGSRRVYTPQMIVNGTEQFVGSNKGDLAKAITNARSIKPLTINRDRDFLNIYLPTIQNFKGVAHIWLFASKSDHQQFIASGENSGKNVHYADAVLYEKSLGRWDGLDKVLSSPVPKIDGIDTVTILVQYNDYGPVIAAGRITL